MGVPAEDLAVVLRDRLSPLIGVGIPVGITEPSILIGTQTNDVGFILSYTSTPSLLAELWSSYVQAIPGAEEPMADEDFNALRLALDGIHRSFLDRCRFEHLL